MTRTRTDQIVLVDMDGVLFDWTTGFYRIARRIADERGVELGLPEPENLTSFYFDEMVPEGDEHTMSVVEATMADDELYADLQPMPGAVEALNEIAEQFPTLVCSTPDNANRACASAKLAGMREHFGPAWGRRTILTHDKTVVTGSVLVDDKPNIKGLRAGRTDWTQVLFTQPYNLGVDLPRLDRWADWRQVLLPAMEQAA